ncbi:MAG: ModD protein [Puniceicoccales bacterium]
MIHFTAAEIDQLIVDDSPWGDLTTREMGIGNRPGRIDYRARHPMVVSGVEEAVSIARKLGVHVELSVPSGSVVREGGLILSAEGSAERLHQLWRAGLTMIEFASGIASRTASLLEAARVENPGVVVAGTRKHPPYLKKVALKALIAGGGTPHRIGLSDSVLIFREHRLFVDDTEAVIHRLRASQPERKLLVEVETREEAEAMVRAGVDSIQLDGVDPEEFRVCRDACKAIRSDVNMLASGGVRVDNAGDYARAGADVLVSSWMYFSPPAEIGVILRPIRG